MMRVIGLLAFGCLTFASASLLKEQHQAAAALTHIKILDHMASNLFAQVKSLAEVSPEVKEEFDNMAQMIADDMLPLVEQSHNNTNSEYETRYNTYVHNFNAAKQQRESAVAHEVTLYNCMEEQDDLQCKWEECEEWHQHCEENCSTNACDYAETVSWQLESTYYEEKSCSWNYVDEDATALEGCTPILELHNALSVQAGEINDAYTHWAWKVADCKLCEDNCTRIKEDCDGARATLDSKIDECNGHHNNADVSVCEFGTDYLTHCTSYESYVELYDAEKGTENSWSTPDRMNEYEALMTIKCYLESYNDDSQTDTFDTSLCDAGFAYPHVIEDYHDEVTVSQQNGVDYQMECPRDPAEHTFHSTGERHGDATKEHTDDDDDACGYSKHAFNPAIVKDSNKPYTLYGAAFCS